MKRRSRIVGRGTLETEWAAWGFLDGVAVAAPQCLVPPGHRLVIVAPHPDDEVLGMGGLITVLAREGREILVVAVTDGEASHRPSRLWPSRRVANVRRQESEEAMAVLAPGRVDTLRLRIGDGRVASDETRLLNNLLDLLRPTDIVFSTWRRDGHPDHEACGRGSAAACALVHCRLIEMPVWMWHWAQPDSPAVPWNRSRRVSLSTTVQATKARALACFGSQLRRVRGAPSTPILPPHVVARFDRTFELFFV